MNYDQLVRAYLKEFRHACSNAVTAGVGSFEMATRPVVHDFVKSLVDMCKQSGANVIVHHDICITRENKPDWRIEDRDTFGVFCLGDHKSLEMSGPLKLSSQENEQIQRYLSLGRPVFVFDGIEFLYYEGPGTLPVRASLVAKPVKLEDDWTVMPVDYACETQFKTILANPGFRKWTERQLMEQLALRARLLADLVRPLLEAPAGSGSSSEEDRLIVSLHALQAIVSKHHDRSLQDAEQCAEFVSQVLTFGLFYVHTRLLCGEESPAERRTKIEDFWRTDGSEEAKALRPFKALTDLLANSLSSSGDLQEWHGDITGLLAHAEYMGKERGPQDFHALFEQFLTAFSPRVRFDRGAFYTPSELTEWLVKAVNVLSLREFGQEVAAVAEKIIDPCCGTGGFLESVVRHCVPAAGRAPLLVGLEVLPAPYALSHYRLAGATCGTAYAGRVRILLTDTLADNLLHTPVLGADGFSDELREAATLVQPPLRVVIGNPPSSIRPVGDSVRTVIERLLDDFRPPVKSLSDRQNIQKALNNEAFRFLRWCAQRVMDSGRGIVAVVLPGAFAHAASFKYARLWLAKHFHSIYVLELDEDARAGGATQSLFQVLQGRLVLLATLRGDASNAQANAITGSATAADRSRTPRRESKSGGGVDLQTVNPALSSESAESHSTTVNVSPSAVLPTTVAATSGSNTAKVSWHSISALSIAEKNRYLAASPDLGSFDPVDIDKEPWLFTPVQSYPVSAWMQCWPLTKTRGHVGIFAQKCSGIKAAPTAVLFHTSDAILQRRCSELASGTRYTDVELIRKWFSGQMKPPRPEKLTPTVRAALGGVAGNSDFRKPYLFRPFVRGRLVDSEPLWSALEASPGGGTRSRPEVRSAFAQGAVGIAVAPSPKDVGQTLTRFAAFAWDLPDNDVAARGNAMVYCDMYPTTSAKDRSSALRSNLTSAIEKYFLFATNPSRYALFYTYAVMSCTAYLEAFEGALYVSADPDSPPRVPIAVDEAARRRLCDLGEKIAACEDFTVVVAPLPTLTACWTTGVTEIDYRDFSFEEESQTLTLEGEGRVTIVIRGVPVRVMGARIAGHQVIKTWLRERKRSYLRGTFKHRDLQELLEVMSRIERQYELLEQVDCEVTAILTGTQFVPPVATVCRDEDHL